MRRKVSYYQYNFEDVYGQEWSVDPVSPEEWHQDRQLSLEDYYDKTVLGEETVEDFVHRKMKALGNACRIMCKTIISGDRVEVELYPVWANRKDTPRNRTLRESREAQKRLNQKNSQKKLIRLMCTNFHKGDLLLTLTYKDGVYPSPEQAYADIREYVKRLRRERKKQGLPPLKYIYVTEHVQEGEQTRKVRIHHHIIINHMDRDSAEGLWEMGRVQSKYAQPDDFELEGFARYISKLSFEKGHRKWASSKNLDKPEEHRHTTRLSRKKFAEIIKAGDGRAELLESLYQGRLQYLDSTTYISQEYGGFYLYSRLRRKESIWEERRAMEGNCTGGGPDCRVFLEYDWSGSFAKGEAAYSILLEARKKDGTPVTRQYFGRIRGTTKGRAVLIMAAAALDRLKPCRVEFHSAGKILEDGIMGQQFALRQKDGFRGVKNADLIEMLMKHAEGFSLTAVSERENEYSAAMQVQRELNYRKMLVMEDRKNG